MEGLSEFEFLFFKLCLFLAPPPLHHKVARVAYGYIGKVKSRLLWVWPCCCDRLAISHSDLRLTPLCLCLEGRLGIFKRQLVHD